MQGYYELPDEDESRGALSPWMLRLQLDNQIMVEKKLSMKVVSERIISDFAGDLDVIYTDDNAADFVLRIRIQRDPNQPMKRACRWDQTFAIPSAGGFRWPATRRAMARTRTADFY